MGIRHLARQRALQLLYALEYATPEDSFQDVERLFLMADGSRRRGWGPFARQLAGEVFARRQELDKAIHPFLRNWTLERLPRIDRLCLRMALCELRFFPDIPLRVTLNEYIDLTRIFSADDSPQYVNAVLDQLARECPQKDFQRGQAVAEQEDSPPENKDEDIEAEEEP